MPCASRSSPCSCWPGTAVAGPFEDAVSARERGDYATALREFRVLAEQGSAGAQFNLGRMYTIGEGVRQDLPRAAEMNGGALPRRRPGAQTHGPKLGDLRRFSPLAPLVC